MLRRARKDHDDQHCCPLGAASGGFYVIGVIIGSQLMGSDREMLLGQIIAHPAGFTAFIDFVAFLHRVFRDAEAFTALAVTLWRNPTQAWGSGTDVGAPMPAVPAEAVP